MGAVKPGPQPRKPTREIRLAAKTGFVSRDTWAQFFAHGSDRWLRNRWATIRDSRLFEALSKERAPEVMVLSSAGRIIAKREGYDPVSPPSILNLKHDDTLSKFVLDLESLGLIKAWKSEAELERKVIGDGSGISLARLMKFPDAEINPTGSESHQVLAIEVELTLKSRIRYVDALNRYAGKKNLLGVLFIAGSDSIREALIETREKQKLALYSLPVGVMRLTEWKSKKLLAPVSFLKRDITLQELMTRVSNTIGTRSA